MKILRVVPELHYGGVETRSRILAEGLRKHHQVVLCVLGKTGAIFEQLQHRGIHAIRLQQDVSIRNPRCGWALARLVSELKPDVIHSSILEANVHGAMARMLTARVGPALIMEEVGISKGVARRKLRLRLALSGVYRLADKIVAVSDAVRRYLQEEEWVPSRRIATIYNCHSPRFREPPDVPAEDRGRLELLAVGRLVRIKNHQFLLKVSRNLKDKGVHHRLRLVGEGPERTNLECLVGQWGLQDEVVFLGYREDVPELMHTSHVLVHPSHYEGYGLVLAEALASGLPILAAPVGGIPEVVGPDLRSHLLPLDEKAWTDRLMEMAQKGHEERRREAEPGVRFVRERYSPERYLEAISQLYQDVVDQRNSKGAQS